MNSYILIGMYWIEPDKLRWLEKQNRWYRFINPIRRMPLENMLTNRDYRGFDPDRLLSEFSVLEKWPDVPGGKP
jgi:hypothetical protein